MKRFLSVAAVLALAFVVFRAWAARNPEGILRIEARTDTAIATTRATGKLAFFEGDNNWKSIVGDLVVGVPVESTGASAGLESVQVVLCSDKGQLTYRMDSINWDVDVTPDTLHVSRIGNDTMMGHNLYILYTVVDTYNTVHNVPITWQIKYNLEVR